MGWRYRVGAGVWRLVHATLSRLPPIRAVPTGNWPYDVRRFAGRQQIGPIIDAGANIGQTAWALTRYFPNDPIYCFEPVAATFAVLQARFGGKVTCVHAALGAAVGAAEIVLHSDSELNTLTGPSREESMVGTEIVNIVTLDGFCAERGIEAVGLLKMDVQGWELAVLDGARGLLDRRAIAQVLCEVGFRADQTDVLSFGVIHERLLQEGFMFAGLYDQFRHGARKQYVSFANAIYVLPGSI